MPLSVVVRCSSMDVLLIAIVSAVENEHRGYFYAPGTTTALMAGLALAVMLTASCSSAPVRATAPSTASVAASPRAPTSASPSPIPAPGRSVVGLGDSVTAAYHCGCVDFVTQLAAGLPTTLGGPGRAVNLGVSGLTTAGLAAQVASDAGTGRALGAAGIVVVTVGANDLVPLVQTWRSAGCGTSCVRPAVDAMGARLAAVLRTLRATTPRGSALLVTTYWNVFQDGDVARQAYGPAFVSWSDAVTLAANASICAATRTADGVCVDLYAPFKGPVGDRDDTALLADDGDHPNADGEAVIAGALLTALH